MSFTDGRIGLTDLAFLVQLLVVALEWILGLHQRVTRASLTS